MSSGITYSMCRYNSYMSSLFCEGCLVSAAVVVWLRFAVSLQREPLVPHGTRGCLSVQTSCNDLEQVGPLCMNILTANVERLSSLCWPKPSLFQIWNMRWPSWRCAAWLVAEISQTLWNKILWGVWSVMKTGAFIWGCWDKVAGVSLEKVVVGGCVDNSAVFVEWGNGARFCLHFQPFLTVPF